MIIAGKEKGISTVISAVQGSENWFKVHPSLPGY